MSCFVNEFLRFSLHFLVDLRILQDVMSQNGAMAQERHVILKLQLPTVDLAAPAHILRVPFLVDARVGQTRLFVARNPNIKHYIYNNKKS